MGELKPCPFCGGKAITATFLDYDDLDYMAFEVNDSESIDGEVTCENERCINGWYLSPKDWNTRPIEDALNKRIAELEAELDRRIRMPKDLWFQVAELSTRVNELEAAQRWIPVSEQLPDVGKVVHVISVNYIEYFTKTELVYETAVLVEIDGVKTFGFVNEFSVWSSGDVTHWMYAMPLPTPPEVQE